MLNSQSQIEVVAPPPRAGSWTPEQAFAYCRKIALGHYENFPVGSLLVPRARRKHFYSIYAFARAADDFADEGKLSRGERLRQLGEWRAALERAGRGEADHPVFIALRATIEECRLPLQLFHDLLDAFTLDVERSRHQTFEDLLSYCRCSANPVGRLILLLFDYRDEELHRLSDDICSALQLTNFWQDILIDLAKDRIYLPQADLAKFGYCEDDLRAHRYNDSYLAMMNNLAERTEALFQRGKPLCKRTAGRLSIELRLVWLGGTNLLAALKQERFNIFAHRPTIGNGKKLQILFMALMPGFF
jgi:phytoene synthase